VLSICIAIKNRSRVHVDGRELLLFPNCVQSIVQSVPRELPCEIVVTDWMSDDWPLEQWLEMAARPLLVRVVQASGGFSRGRGLNLAAAEANGEDLLFTDADCLLSAALIERGLRYVHDNNAFFPVLFSFHDPEHRSGWWRHSGYGNCMMTRGVFERAGRWPQYCSWGKEDTDFFSSVSSIAQVVREEVPGFYHQWHPEDILWKDQYADRDPGAIEEIKQSRQALRELAQVVPAGCSLILVDEARFGVDEIEGRQARPYLEADGEYAGPPPDDATAIRELKRLRAEGSTYIAFAWMAFWWLEQYPGLHRHLRSAGRCILENSRLVVFALA
jgi:hypothetical protein